MCGLTGFVASATASEDLVSIVRRMHAALAHRGPDDAGEWVDADSGAALGFRRLAIIDLSPAGHQPMLSASSRYVATLNGEIYNFEELRRELRAAGLAPPFRGHSDTEVMLAAFDAWGIDAAVRRFNGMFAIAVWDREARKLLLIRDRMGVKPLYFGFAGSTFVYASELKALRQHPGFDAQIDRDALALYMRFMVVPAPFSIYKGIGKVLPGTIVTFDPASRETKTSTYWSVSDVATRGAARPFEGSEEDASQAVEAVLRDAIRIRMVADVPLGIFLSGGVDSSLVAALMQSESASRVRSFSIGFPHEAYDESKFAASVARHLGTDHTELTVTSQDALDVIPKLPSIYDEPFADSSQIPTHLLSMLARRHVTVSLSGDGGDELFGGYTRYILAQKYLRRIAATPRSLRPAMAGSLKMLSTRSWDRLLGPRMGEKVHKLARVMATGNSDAMYFELVSHWSNVVTGGVAPEIPVTRRESWPSLHDPVERMMFFDQISYLPDDILAKVDRASMAASLEVREPLLDYRLVELAWTLPLSMKVRGGRGKRVLRRVLDRYVPASLIERPKMGFGIPLDDWLRGPLREWAESLLDPASLHAEGFFDVPAVRAKWEELLSGRGDWKYYVWAVLMFEAWLKDATTA
jgi:asparagine synthase (glutamine-hydrolysing)